MNRRTVATAIVILMLVVLATWLSGCGSKPAPAPAPPPTTEVIQPVSGPPPAQPPPAPPAGAEDESGAAANAVDLIAAWAQAGAPETAPFAYTGVDGATYQAAFAADILPLFTQNNVWFEGSQACTGCHFANAENSYHEMDLSSYKGILTGADSLEEPPGVSILGESEPGKGDIDWSHSKLRGRLRNNRMPPGFEFDITEANRDGPCLAVSAQGVEVALGEYDCELTAVGLIAAWVEAGAPESGFAYGGAEMDFERDVLPFFTENNMWFQGSQACTGCHFANAENSYHEMDLSSHQGILTGADSLEEPPGVSILGESEPGKGDFDWSHSKLRERLRNNRMPPGFEFDITEGNRDGPMILAGTRK